MFAYKAQFREYWKPGNEESQRISEWVELEAGQRYYLLAEHIEYTYLWDHLSVAVEIEEADTAGHHHAMREIQHIKTDTP